MKLKDTNPTVLVVGAGPAGLFAAMQLTSVANVILVDKGKCISEREHDDPADLASGVGGAGLYSDGKLCLDLRAGGYLQKFLNDEQRRELEESIEALFVELMPELKETKGYFTSGEYEKLEECVLQEKSYRVLNIGTDRGAKLIESLVNKLKSDGVSILHDTTLTKIEKVSSGFQATLVNLSNEINIKADFVILAMGKVGANQQRELCESMGVESASNLMNVGVRLECNSKLLEPLFNKSADPKIKLELPGGSYIKTHCASNNGEVVPVKYGNYMLAGGHQYYNRRSGRSGFSLVWNGIRSRFDVDQKTGGVESLLEPFSESCGDKLAVQLVSNFLAREKSSEDAIAKVPLSCKKVKASNLWELLPGNVCAPIVNMLEELNKLTPAIKHRETVLYAPVVEWWMSTIKANASTMETSVANLYVIGDGSGWSQGIVHSAATGILAGNAIREASENSKSTEENKHVSWVSHF
ncbi:MULTISPECIES: hypothetical protein [unclassified Pseudoalteromonas]|uniref:hypothetical protein n=1 Tax=unclassified Pseudoalteromonas TaxID=194690 RepID=UPI001F3EB487|nr:MULTISPECIES: hypothetical protein [unclassified Pseudoalteromonas]MCF2828783.1 hypothetical protein [Pseudoalteromonas sp. OF5H-5]MCF2832279.1 hypothetical protein [Pseudoalteromonas sp. DL2-H6]MCF2925045.1 hypothetical protein [Pseudoalteromonas sp. DL2-H1]